MQNIDERGAGKTRHHRRHRRAQGERRQNIVPPAVGAHRRQPAQFNGKDLHQKHTERKGRERDAGDRQRHAYTIRPAIAPHGRHDPCRHPEDDRPAHTGNRQPESGHKTAGDFAAHRAAGSHRGAKVALQNVADIVPELHVQRAIEPKLLAHHSHHLGIGFRPGNQPSRIPGQHMHEQKHQHRYNQQRGDQPQQAFNHIIEHASPCANSPQPAPGDPQLST